MTNKGRPEAALASDGEKLKSTVAVTTISVDDARRLTERIRLTAHSARESIEKLHVLVAEAKDGNAHLALGYESWTGYLAEVLGEEPLRLAKDQRQELVGYLAGEGMSTRAIAPVVGASKSQVARDLAGVPIGTPAIPEWSRSEAAFEERFGVRPAGAAALIRMVDASTHAGGDLPQEKVVSKVTPINKPAITGMDGKTYSRPEPRKPPRQPLPARWGAGVYDLDKAVQRLARLAEDDRFDHHRHSFGYGDLDRMIEQLTGIRRRILGGGPGDR